MTALKGIRVLDMTQLLAGPYCTMLLGDLGAEVIKIEKINGGDDTRQMGPYVNGESSCFFQVNRNKKGIALNLKDEKGRELFYKLAKTADIVVENFRPGVTKSLKVDYETIKEINPGVIYCSVSGYGQTGPYAKKGGFDLVMQGMTGIMSMTGEPGGKPSRTGTAIYDVGAGITATYAILAAYINKQNTGKGQFVDVSLAESGLPWFVWEAAAFFAEGTIPEPTGSRHRVSAPYQAMKTKDGYIMLGCANQKTWERFCQGVVNKPEWIEDPRFKTNTDRRKNVDELEQAIEDILLIENAEVWLRKCEKAGVPAGPINNFAEAMEDPHFQARDMVQEVNHPVIGNMKTIGIPTKFSETPGEIKSAAPVFGQHTDEVFSSLGLSKQDLEALRNSGVVK